MTHSAAYATGLMANGTDLTRTDLRILMRVTSGLGEVWEVRGRDTIIPSAHGQTARNRKRNRLVIVAEGMIQGDGATRDLQEIDFVTLQDIIRDLMDPTQSPYTLEVTREDGSQVSITARPINVMWGDDDIPTYRTLSCEWLAIGADWVASGS